MYTTVTPVQLTPYLSISVDLFHRLVLLVHDEGELKMKFVLMTKQGRKQQVHTYK